jgi:hypothetical protein
MQNFDKTLEIINLRNQVVLREFETAVNSPFAFPVAPESNNPEWQPLLDYPVEPSGT